MSRQHDRYGSRYGSSRRGEFPSMIDSIRGILHILIPAGLTVMFIFSGADRWPVWKYSQNGTTYEIAAQGYLTISGNGNKVWSERELAWPSPANWPESIRSLRQWLIFHLILGVLVGLYDLILVISCLLDRSYTYLTNYPKWWMTVLGTLCCIFSFSLASRDAVFWAQGVASNDGSFKPEFLGGFDVIGGIMFSLLWLLLLRPWSSHAWNGGMTCSCCYKPDYYTDRSANYKSSSTRPSGGGSRSKTSGSRSNKSGR